MVLAAAMRGKTRGRIQIGAGDPSLTGAGGMVAVTELGERLGVIAALDAGMGPVKQRRRGFSGGQVLAGMAAAQLAGEDFLAGLDRVRADQAGQLLVPVPGLATSTAAGIARRFTGQHWRGAEAGLARATARMAGLLPAGRAAGLAGGPVTTGIDATGVEVYGSKKRGVAYNYQGQRAGRPHLASWAETEIPLAGRPGPAPAKGPELATPARHQGYYHARTPGDLTPRSSTLPVDNVRRSTHGFGSEHVPSSSCRRRASGPVGPAISISLSRLVAPVTSVTCEGGTPKAPAAARSAARVAAPPAGRAVTRMTRASPRRPPTTACGEPGVTRTATRSRLPPGLPGVTATRLAGPAPRPAPSRGRPA
jgi:hypothetical protein